MPKTCAAPQNTAAQKPCLTKDPLQQLFEHFILNRSYENAAAFTRQLAENYIAYLDSTPAHMPFEVRQNVLEDLASEAQEMLIKRMYGGFEGEPSFEAAQGHVCTYRNGRVAGRLPLTMPELPKP